ncbi:MAG: NUDIX domain-containing protein [Planctomycetes bacterium]|nr:NUDIX domain-containing protein [Planctomycetota bacterium]
MQREAAGFIVIDASGAFLLLRSRRHDEWGFPKGHRDEEDRDLLETARRELREETGLEDVTVLDGFECVLDYKVKAGVRGDQTYDKRVVYYLARSDHREIRLSDEHIEYRWVTFDQGRELLPYDDLRHCLRRASECLKLK